MTFWLGKISIAGQAGLKPAQQRTHKHKVILKYHQTNAKPPYFSAHCPWYCQFLEPCRFQYCWMVRRELFGY